MSGTHWQGARAVLCLCVALVSVSRAVEGGEQPSAPAPSPKAIESMRLLDSQDPYLRELGFLRLEALREPSTLETIKKHLTDDDPDIRAYSLRAVAAIEGLPSVPLLLNVLKRDPEPRVRRAALLGLEPFEKGNPDILPAFLTSLRDRKVEVRIVAVDIVSRVENPKAKEALQLRNKRERDPDVRRVLVLAMKR